MFANGAFTEGSHGAAARGLHPRQVSIPRDTTLYRFVDLRKGPASRVADGPWWLEYEHYRTIVGFADRHGYSIGYAARLMLAIFHEWSELNAVVGARVVEGPLLAWKGRGKQVVTPGRDPRDVATPRGLVTERRGPDGGLPSATKTTPTQGAFQVLQLFIPGLGPPHRQFDRFFKLRGFEHVQSYPPQ
jgi:hypothetical protein